MSEFAEISAASIPDARRSLIIDWHDMNEAGCCDEGGPFCEASKGFAQGYLSAVAAAEDAYDIKAMIAAVEAAGWAVINPRPAVPHCYR